MTPSRWRWSATTASSCSARTSATSAASSAARRDCRSGSASTAASTRRSTSRASSAPRSAWRRTGCGRASRSSSPTTCIPPTTRSCRRRPACGTAPPATSRRRSSIRMPTGGGIYGGQTHSQSPEALFTHVAGLKTVVVSNPYDAKGLLIAAIEDDDPVIFLEPKRLYNGPFDGHHDRPIVPWSQHPLGEVPEGYYTIELGDGAGAPRGRRPDRAHVRHARARRRGGRRRSRGSTPRSSTCARSCRSTSTPSWRRCRRPDAASSLHEATLTSGLRRRAQRRSSRSGASTTSKHRSSGCAAGTRRTRTRSSGRTSPGPTASAAR